MRWRYLLVVVGVLIALGVVVALSHRPHQLAELGEQEARLVGVSRGRLYWWDARSGRCDLWRLDLRTGTSMAVDRNCNPGDLVLDGDGFLLLTAGSRVVHHALGPGGEEVKRLVGEYPLSWSMAADPDFVYVNTCANRCQLIRVSRGGGDATVLQERGVDAVRQIAVDQDAIFWLERTGVAKPPKSGLRSQDGEAQLMRASKEPGSAVVVLVENFPSKRFFLTDKDVLWFHGGALWRASKQGGLPEPIHSAEASAVAAVHGDTLEFATGDGIWEKRDGKAARRLIALDGGPAGIAVDETAVYWLDRQRNSIFSVRRS